MQGFITTPIAKAVLNADNVDYVTSSSTLGSSTVSVNMVLNADPDQALVDVLAKVQQVRGQLPDGRRGPGRREGHRLRLRADVHRRPLDDDEPAAGDRIPDAGRSSRASRRSRASATRRSSAAANSPCASGSIRSGSPRATSRRPTCSTAIRASNFLSAPGKTENEFVAYAIQTATTLQTPEAFGALAGARRRRRDRAALRRGDGRIRRRERRRARHLQRPGRHLPRRHAVARRQRARHRRRRCAPSCRRSRASCRRA